jgi:hypothetical protein
MGATSPTETCAYPKKKKTARLRTQDDCSLYGYCRANLKFHLKPKSMNLLYEITFYLSFTQNNRDGK